MAGVEERTLDDVEALEHNQRHGKPSVFRIFRDE
jgi:hypothetical protein